jgi:ABC-2 type transport system ATP-binding protein
LHTAAALLGRPSLLLLDEPTTGVDVDTRREMLEAVRRLAVEDGTAVCYSTHYLHEVETLGASVAILEQGSIIARGNVRDLIARHGTSVIELVFDGPPPTLTLDRRTEVDGSKLRIYTNQAGADLRLGLERLGSAAERLRGVEVLTSNLESVFLVLTGRRFAEGDSGERIREAR